MGMRLCEGVFGWVERKSRNGRPSYESLARKGSMDAGLREPPMLLRNHGRATTTTRSYYGVFLCSE
jgi:hypothetical protein